MSIGRCLNRLDFILNASTESLHEADVETIASIAAKWIHREIVGVEPGSCVNENEPNYTTQNGRLEDRTVEG
jgi:hypothetical protein